MKNFSGSIQFAAFPWWQMLGDDTTSLTALVVAIGSLTVLLLTWAAFFRKRRSRHLSLSRYGAVPTSDSTSSRGRRRRRRRHEHRPRNPTLAETGGLPHSRTDSTSLPS